MVKISGLLGHNSIHTTYEYYCEVMDEKDKIIAFMNDTFVPEREQGRRDNRMKKFDFKKYVEFKVYSVTTMKERVWVPCSAEICRWFRYYPAARRVLQQAGGKCTER